MTSRRQQSYLALSIAAMIAVAIVSRPSGFETYSNRSEGIERAEPATAGKAPSDKIPGTESVSPADLRGPDPARFVECDSQPTGILRMACRVGSAAYTISTGYPDKDLEPDELFKAFSAIEAANAVRTSLSAGRYSYLLRFAKGKVPSGNETCLEQGAGICGNQVEAFLAIMDALGITARPIKFFYTTDGMRESHIAAEVFYLGGWHFIDVTWGFAVPPDGGGVGFRSLEEIRADPDGDGLENSLDAWSFFARASRRDPMEYLRRRELDILIDGQGVVTLAVPAKQESRDLFDNVPNYVGDATPGQQRRATSLRFVGSGKYKVTLRVSGMAGCSPAEGDALEINGNVLPLSDKAVTFDVDREALLSMRTRQDTCYVVFSDARFVALQ